jgi:hypothetical protein
VSFGEVFVGDIIGGLLTTDVGLLNRRAFFFNGDLIKEDGKFPIMPFDDRNGSFSAILSEDQRSNPMKLVSFGVTDVDHAHRLKKSIPINGFMVMGITRDGNFVDSVYGDKNLDFRLWPAHSQILIPFTPNRRKVVVKGCCVC